MLPILKPKIQDPIFMEIGRTVFVKRKKKLYNIRELSPYYGAYSN